MLILLPASYTYKALAEAAQGFVLSPHWLSEAGCFCCHLLLLRACVSVYLLLLLFLILVFYAE